MSKLPPWQHGTETSRASTLKSIFHEGFWPNGVGHPSRAPIFIVGFVRTGSTLLERVLDSHSEIVGTGEDSVFNGRLDVIRTAIVEASLQGELRGVAEAVRTQASRVLAEIRERWEAIREATSDVGEDDVQSEEPVRFADKMLMNYFNVGFIHMLFPRALILHVIRDPMDTLFSAYKHEFPPGTLDYTSRFDSLAELYTVYRDLMDHWEEALPGRITHVRYEDMVKDMPNIAKKVIRATGLEWEEEVLNFHKKKQAVNTLSTSQVRKGVYSHHLNSWIKYEDQLAPLKRMIGDRVRFDQKTTLKGYRPLPVHKELK